MGARWWPICQCKFRGLRRCNRSYNPDSPPVGNGVEICSCRMVVLYDPGVGFEVRFLRGTFATPYWTHKHQQVVHGLSSWCRFGRGWRGGAGFSFTPKLTSNQVFLVFVLGGMMLGAASCWLRDRMRSLHSCCGRVSDRRSAFLLRTMRRTLLWECWPLIHRCRPNYDWAHLSHG